MSEQFEHSIRKKLQDADIPFDPAAWEQMKKRLDDSDRRRPAIFWWILSGLLILTLAGGSFWWWTSNNKSPVTAGPSEHNAPVENQLSTDKPATTNEPANQVPVSVNDERKLDQSSIATSNMKLPAMPDSHHSPAASNDRKPGSNQSSIVGNERNSSAAASSRQSYIVTNERNSSTLSRPGQSSIVTDKRNSSTTSNSDQPSIVRNNRNSSSSNSNQSSIVTDKRNSPTTSNSKQPPTTTNNLNSSTDVNMMQPQTPSNSNQSSIVKNNANPSNSSEPSTVTKDKHVTQDSIQTKKPNRKGLEAGITLGPDYNVAASLKRGKVGFNFGVILKYNLSNRWSIQSGAIYNKKIYGANASEYTFNYPNTYKWVAADCNVLDVPLNVFYTFSENGRQRWSAMAGVSSYFMLKEKYDYWYDNGYKVSHEYQNQHQHYLSVVNLGVNWERQTTGRLRWSLQPYVKVPLGGVGQGSIKLYSAGLALQLTMGKK